MVTATPVSKPVALHRGLYKCECGKERGAFFHAVEMRMHWLRCPQCERRVWPWKLELMK